MSALKSRLAIGLTGFPLVILAILDGGWIFSIIIILAATIAFKEFLALKLSDDNPILWLIFGFVYVLGSLFCLLVLREIDTLLGSYFTVLLFAGVSVNDSFSYIFGKWIGGKKIAPSMSPNKTYAGMIGGYFLSIIFISLYFNKINYEVTIIWFITIILISSVSQLGDIIISYFKRLSKLKNTGNIIPGHGGILDRIDGMIFAFPIYYLIELSGYLI